MDIETQYRVKHTILLQVIRDVLIEKGLTTHDEFNEKYKAKIENYEGFSEEERAILKENM